MNCGKEVSEGSRFSSILLDWYAENKRELPWRNSTNPYIIWISEIILQQTRVAQGYEYFLRFINRFPDLDTLASAEEEEVLKYWQGLGYYSRARNLHAAARSMNGTFPQGYKEVLALRGVGEYTAAAICSFAYNLPYAVVDGNVYRVISRYLGISDAIDSTTGKKIFKELAQELMDEKHPGLYNQAIMDFGAIQCTPQSPGCSICPLSDSCIAFAEGTVKQLPVKQLKTKTLNRYFHYLYICEGGNTFLSKRTEKDIWMNLFEFPLIERPQALQEEELCALPEFRDIFPTDLKPLIRPALKNVKHVLSHRIIYADFYEVTLPAGTCVSGDYLRIPVEEIGNYPVSRLIEIFLEKIAEQQSNRQGTFSF